MSVNLIVFIASCFFVCFFFNHSHTVIHLFPLCVLHVTPSLTVSPLLFTLLVFPQRTPSLADTSPSLASAGSSRSVSSSTSSSSSSTSSSASRAVDGREAEVRLLPPLLKDQAWGVHSQEAFLLFCLALGEWSLWRWLGSHLPLLLLHLESASLDLKG